MTDTATTDTAAPSAATAANPEVVVWKRIPAGTFTMGCTQGDTECNGDEVPAHPVTISRDYDLAETLTTNAQYRKCVEAGTCATPSQWEGGNDFPVVNVSWNDAHSFCGWAGGRLPAEAEWERAARGGQEGWKYPWGNAIGHENANYSGMESRDRWERTSPVGSFDPNGYGLYDMAGNAWEWVGDWYGADDYKRPAGSDPKGPASGSRRVLRGGSWYISPGWLRVSSRGGVTPDSRDVNVGFRCARDVIP